MQSTQAARAVHQPDSDDVIGSVQWSDTHQFALGQQECVVTFRYVSELAVEGDFVRVALPITRLPIHGSDSTTTADTYAPNHQLTLFGRQSIIVYYFPFPKI